MISKSIPRTVSLLAISAFCVASSAFAQTPLDSLIIRVETNRVVVPVFLLQTPPNFGPIFEALPPDRFRLYEDGKEQKIESVERILPRNSEDINIRDNLGMHSEWSYVPEAIWSTRDVPNENQSGTIQEDSHYLIYYSPPPSKEGACHRIKVKVARADTEAMFRDQYCTVHHSSSDPVEGTPLENKLEQYLASSELGKIHPSAQASYFYVAPDQARVHIDIEFPFEEVKYKKWSDGALPFGILLIAYGPGAKVVKRVGEQRPGNPDYRRSARSYTLAGADALFTLTRYDAQIDLPSGKYKIAIAVSIGSRFGMTQIPLAIDEYDERQLGISSIALCKRVRKIGVTPAAAEFVPLIAQGYEFTPSADTVFGKSDSLMAYFEVYEPLSQSPPGGMHLKYRMKITNQNTGSVALDTEEDADSSIQLGKSTIPIAVEPVLKDLNLSSGKYTFAIQATDSAGRTATRTTEFSIE